jgi:stearoyl-CoA desaturase (delta-9 desaturase)
MSDLKTVPVPAPEAGFLSRAFRIAVAILLPILGFGVISALVTIAFGERGIAPNFLAEGAFWKVAAYLVLMTHITITAMSLCFHRMHTHQGVTFPKWVDRGMQSWLALTTGMSKRDWVSIHIYHHAHSDQEKDPHSPKQKGLARIFFFGVYDYVVAKNDPEVLKIRRKIPEDRFEKFVNDNPLLGPIVVAATLTVLFGPLWGGVLALLTYAISPLFAVGGVNAIAHAIGYRNYETRDESRNIGFIFPLNWMICGELDHNNHHAHPRSCSFRHRWYEFDIGYFYICVLSAVGLAKVKTAHSLSHTTDAERRRMASRALQGAVPVEKPKPLNTFAS